MGEKRYSLTIRDDYEFDVVENKKGLYPTRRAALERAVAWLSGEREKIDRSLSRSKEMLEQEIAEDGTPPDGK